MDYQIFKSINGMAGQSKIIDRIMIFLSSYMLYAFIIIPIVLYFIKKTRTIGIIGLCSILISLVISQLIPFLYYKNRPFVDHDVNLLIEKGISSSFPSDQAIVVFACAISVWYFKRTSGMILFALACTVAISRTYVGHHYPFDLIASAIIALIVVISSIKLHYYITSRKKSNSLTY